MSYAQWAVIATATITVLQWALIPRLLAQRSKSPTAVLAWLWALLLFPVLGAFFYILMGSERVVRKRLALVRALDSELAPDAPPCETSDMPELARVNGFPPPLATPPPSFPTAPLSFPSS